MADVGDRVRLVSPLDKERPGIYEVLAIGDDGAVSVAVPFSLPAEFVEVVEKAGDIVPPPDPVVIDLGTAAVLPPFDKEHPGTYRVLKIGDDGGVVLAIDGYADGIGFGAEFVRVAPPAAEAEAVP